MFALVASNSREIPCPMKSPGAENIVTTMLRAETAGAALADDAERTGTLARITTAHDIRATRPTPCPRRCRMAFPISVQGADDSWLPAVLAYPEHLPP